MPTMPMTDLEKCHALEARLRTAQTRFEIDGEEIARLRRTLATLERAALYAMLIVEGSILSGVPLSDQDQQTIVKGIRAAVPNGPSYAAPKVPFGLVHDECPHCGTPDYADCAPECPGAKAPRPR